MKVISGGQTGVDQAGLDAAIEVGIEHGGYCPLNRRWEGDGCIPEKYKLEEMATFSYVDRTKQNIIESEATLLINEGELSGGTSLTRKFAIEVGKPLWVMHLDNLERDDAIKQFLMFTTFDPVTNVLNVAGPRESKRPGIHDRTYEFLVDAFTAWKEKMS